MSRAGAGAPYATTVLAALMGLAALTAYLWPLGLSAFPPIAGILLIPVFRNGRPSWAWGALALFTAWALAATLWSPVFSGSGPIDDYASAETQTWAKIALQLGLYAVLVTTAARLSARSVERLDVVFVVAATALAGVLLLEAALGTRLYHRLTEWSGHAMRPDLERRAVAQATYALVLMAWPAMVLLGRRGWRAAAALVAVSSVVSPLLLGAWAPPVAFLSGGAVYWLMRRTGARGAAWIGGALAGVILLAPWVVLAAQPLFDAAAGRIGASWAARLELWSFTAEQTPSHLLFGHGLDASRAFQPFMLHPHSAPLQIWLELGAVGAVLAAAMWVLVVRMAGRLGPQAVAAAVVYFVIGALSFGLWQEWWLGLAAMTAIWCLLADPARKATNSAPMIEA